MLDELRIKDELRLGEEYWALERKLCHAMTNKEEVYIIHVPFSFCLENGYTLSQILLKIPCLTSDKVFSIQILVDDVMKAIHLKSFDYRVLNLLLYELRGAKVPMIS